MTERLHLDPYSTLGVARGASPEAIKRAFRKLALLHHPDRNPGDAKSEARFKLINAAYQRLKECEWILPPPAPASKSTVGPDAADAPVAPVAPDEQHARPQFWPDGHPIYYPTAAEIDALMRHVGDAVLLPRLRAVGSRISKAIAYVYLVVGVGGIAVILILIAFGVLRRLITGR